LPLVCSDRVPRAGAPPAVPPGLLHPQDRRGCSAQALRYVPCVAATATAAGCWPAGLIHSLFFVKVN